MKSCFRYTCSGLHTVQCTVNHQARKLSWQRLWQRLKLAGHKAALSLKAFLPASTVCLKTRYLPCALGGPHSSLLPVYHMRPDFSQPSGPQERLEKEKRLTSDLGRAATKLQELLKTTQGQLTKERDTVKKLQEQLEKAVSIWCRLDCRASLHTFRGLVHAV